MLRGMFCAVLRVALGVSCVPAMVLSAQGTSETLFLLLPIGARAIGMGQAAVATRGGSESVWWNPAGLAGDTTSELALHHSNSVGGQQNVVTLVLPTRHIGTFAPSVNVLDLEEQGVIDDEGNQQGVILPTDVVFALTYAASPLRFVTLGATVKHIEARVRCSGQCTNLPIGGTRANGTDVGAQIRLQTIPLTFGVALRNLGVGQGDLRLSRLDMGAQYRVSVIERYTQQEIALYAAGGVVSTTKLDSASTRIGADLVFEGKVHVRGGYVYDRENGSGTSIGFGVIAGKLAFDLARAFGGSIRSVDSDRQPTYFSLRYLW